MSYRMNLGKELSQIEQCKTLDEIIAFLEDHNLQFDHYYLDNSANDKWIYIIANYTDPENGVFIQITFNL